MGGLLIATLLDDERTRLDFSDTIDYRFPLNEVNEAYETLEDKIDEVIGSGSATTGGIKPSHLPSSRA